LWTTAHTLLGDERYLELAAAAAWGAYGGHGTAPGDICCGLAGRAYSLAGLHRHTGNEQWLARARLLGDRAVERIRDHPLRRDSLYKGEVGVALLLEELSGSTSAGLPLYEPEGWPAAWDLTPRGAFNGEVTSYPS
jgi:serine/threonine-protein kinase